MIDQNSKYLHVLVLSISLITLYSSCENDPLYSGTSPKNIQLIIPDRDILDVAVDYNRAYMLDNKENLILLDRNDSSLNYLNQLNSWIRTDRIVDIQSSNDSTVIIGESTNGLIHHDATTLKIKQGIGGLRVFNVDTPLTLVSFSPTMFRNGSAYFTNNPVQLVEYTACAGWGDTLYFGTKTKGIGQLTRHMNSFSLDRFLDSDIGIQIDSCIAIRRKGALFYVLTKSQFAIRVHGNWIVDNANNWEFMSSTINQNTVFLSTEKEIYTWANSELLLIADLSDYLGANSIRALDVDEKGRFWLATSNGLYLYTD